MALPGKLRFDTEDHAPSSYYEKGSRSPPSQMRLPFQTPNPEAWIQAPEFVPRSKQLHDAFSSSSPPPFDPDLEKASFYNYDEQQSPDHQTIIEQPFIPSGHHFPEVSRNPIHQTRVSIGGVPVPPLLPNPHLPFPMLPSFPGRFPNGPPPFAFVPNGYSANVTNINPGLGPPIPAIVLKKKRRRRNKEKTQSMLLEGESESCSPPVPSDPKEFPRETTGDRTTIEEEYIDERNERESTSQRDQAVGGSCPDLSQQQLEMWDDFLYESVVNGRGRASAERRVLSNMQIAVNPAYEILPKNKNEADEFVEMSNSAYGKQEKEINGNLMTASMILQSLKEKFAKGLEPAKTREKSPSDEFEALAFRPEISKYGYPQFDSDKHHVTSFHPDGVTSSIQSMKIRAPMVEDSLEGMHIRVNAFEDDEDLELSESECPEPSRFQRLQWAIQQKKHQQISQNGGPPERVCCSIM
ncbi:unnamed protein product, partial [Mesorhabditis belari]|uniref:Uncharacterized protein n=1 Tax=Mesorhabditis belari TaxID=2138241 RepID=A0AAF3EYJ6_9BILA